MRAIVKGLGLALLLVPLAGCAVTGQWTMKSITPESAKEHFQLQWMCLMSNGDYMACATEGTQCKKMSGTYMYDAKAKTLTFKTDGKERKYNADLLCPGGEMKVWSSEPGTEWTAVMKRGKCCPADKCTCPEKCRPQTCPMHEKKGEPAAKTEEPKKAEPKK